MHGNPASRARLESALAAHGLRVLGGWEPAADDVLPALPQSRSVAVIWMVGQVGSECWGAFSSSPFYGDGQPDPMDRWAKSIGNALASELGGSAIYPSDGPPYVPFQQWARRSAPVQTSPLMLQMHPDFGLWHAYRFALASPDLPIDDACGLVRYATLTNPDICLNCNGQPCLSACPVEAFTPSGYNVDACATHLHRAEGQTCMQSGCLARRACPVAPGHRYVPEHAAFHMAAFARRH